MSQHSEDEAIDRLWREYGRLFDAYDDLTLARWMSQTLGQLHGRVCRYSHPLIGAYRMASMIAYDRNIWFQRLASLPADYLESGCCRAPMLPLFTRDIHESGLICEHCNEILIEFEDLPEELQPEIEDWAGNYNRHHQVAHWNETEQRKCEDYQAALDRATEQCKSMLVDAATRILPKCLEHFPAILWEDQDECLGIKPEDILLQ